MSEKIVITGSARTPMGGLLGALAEVPAVRGAGGPRR